MTTVRLKPDTATSLADIGSVRLQPDRDPEIRVPVNRRDFLLLRAGQPAVLSCERLFMRYIDSQADDSTARLFDHLATDLRRVTEVRIDDPSWRSREDFDSHLTAVLDAFVSRGGRVTTRDAES